MAYTKKRKTSKPKVTPEERKKFKEDKKLRDEARKELVLNKIYDFVAKPKSEWSENDDETKVIFYNSKVDMLPMKFQQSDKDKPSSIFYEGMNAIMLMDVVENRDISVSRFIPYGKVKELIKKNKDNIPDDLDVSAALKGKTTPVFKWNFSYIENQKIVYNKERIAEIEKMTRSEMKDNDIYVNRGLAHAGNVFAAEDVMHLIPKDTFENDPYFKKKAELDARRMSPEKENAYFKQKAQNLINALGIPVIEKEGSNRCYFSPSDNHIVVPPKHRFDSDESRLAILIHEGIHSTGIPLNREFAPKTDAMYEIKYAKEEIIAEMATSMLCHRLGLKTFTSHAKYMKHYADIVCKNDNKAVLTSLVKQATDAVNYVSDKLETYELKLEQELKQKLDSKIEPDDISLKGNTVEQTFALPRGKSVTVVVNLDDIDNPTFKNESSLNEFACNKPSTKSIDEVKAELKENLRDYTVIKFETCREELKIEEEYRAKEQLEKPKPQPEQAQKKDKKKKSKLSI